MTVGHSETVARCGDVSMRDLHYLRQSCRRRRERVSGLRGPAVASVEEGGGIQRHPDCGFEVVGGRRVFVLAALEGHRGVSQVRHTIDERVVEMFREPEHEGVGKLQCKLSALPRIGDDDERFAFSGRGVHVEQADLSSCPAERVGQLVSQFVLFFVFAGIMVARRERATEGVGPPRAVEVSRKKAFTVGQGS